MSAVVGFVGLGAMGARIAARLRSAGVELTVYDVRPEAAEQLRAAGATVAASPRAVADAAATVMMSLPTPEIARDVAADLARGDAIKTLVDVSTVGPQAAEAIAADLASHGVAAVDAPVSGGPAGAEAGRLTVMAAGDAESIELVRPLLETFAARVFVVGEQPGQGQFAKVINNLLSASAIAATAEALVLGVRAGLSPATLLDVIGVSSGASNAASDKFPKQVLTREFNHGFRLALMAKDVELALGEARRREVPMLLGANVAALWSLAAARDDGEGDCTAIVRLFEEWGGAEIVEPERSA